MQRQFEDLLLGSIALFCLAAELESFVDFLMEKLRA